MKRESNEAPRSSRKNSLSKSRRRVRWKLRRTKRTVFKVRVALSRLGESTDEAPQQSTSSGPVPQLQAAPSDGRLPSVKRREICEETHRKATKKTRRNTSSSSSSSGPGPSHRRRKAKRRARKEIPLVKRLLKAKVGEVSEYPSSSLQEPTTDESSVSLDSSVYAESSDSSPVEEVDLESFITHEEFSAKYQMTECLKSGGNGVVYAGIRKRDNLDVAVKVCHKSLVGWVHVMQDQTVTMVPLEVAMLTKVGAGPGADDCNVTPLLLDWYEADEHILLVLERPTPCMDLVDHVNNAGPYLNEAEAKVIFKQLVDAAIEMLSCRVFHRDIKPDNVLVETGHDVPRARFIDFGCSTNFYSRQSFSRPQGTAVYTSPEWYRGGQYQAEPTTAWQLGLTLYCMLNRKRAFAHEETVASGWQPKIRSKLSQDCKDLLQSLMDKDPETRMSIYDIKDHPWMN